MLTRHFVLLEEYKEDLTMNTKVKFNVVIPRVGLDENGDFYCKRCSV